MNTYTLRSLVKEVLKVVYAIPRQKATQRTANLYSSLSVKHQDLSPKSSTTIRQYINKKVSGSENVDFFEYIQKKYAPTKLNYIAGLGSHHANYEREVMKRGFAERIDCYELSAGAINTAKELAQQEKVEGMNFIQQDLNKTQFVRDQYDAVFAFKSLHHIENLEGLFENVRKVIKPGGYFFIDDFFGPRRLQWTEEQLRVTNEILALLPDELKTDLGSFRPKVYGERKRGTVEENIAIDPSEAVRSDEVMPVLKNYFDIVETINYGGNIHLILFNKIMGNFRDDHPLSQTIIRLIMYIEELSIRNGIFKDSDFKYVVARPR